MNLKIFLRDHNMPLVNKWREAFADCDDVEASCGNIFDITADAILSPANSFGFMDGGIDLAYSNHFGWGYEKTPIVRRLFILPLYMTMERGPGGEASSFTN
jgi:hypothetical protein